MRRPRPRERRRPRKTQDATHVIKGESLDQTTARAARPQERPHQHCRNPSSGGRKASVAQEVGSDGASHHTNHERWTCASTEYDQNPAARPEAGQKTATSEEAESRASPTWAAKKYAIAIATAAAKHPNSSSSRRREGASIDQLHGMRAAPSMPPRTNSQCAEFGQGSCVRSIRCFPVSVLLSAACGSSFTVVLRAVGIKAVEDRFSCPMALAAPQSSRGTDGRSGSRAVLAATSAARQLTPRFRTELLQRESRKSVPETAMGRPSPARSSLD